MFATRLLIHLNALALHARALNNKCKNSSARKRRRQGAFSWFATDSLQLRQLTKAQTYYE